MLRRLSMATTSSLDMSCISVQLASIALPGKLQSMQDNFCQQGAWMLELHISHGMTLLVEYPKGSKTCQHCAGRHSLEAYVIVQQ